MDAMQHLMIVVIHLLMVTALSQSSTSLRQRGHLQIRTVSQCYGKQIAARCPASHVIRIISATYRQSRECTIGGTPVSTDDGHVTSVDGSDDDPTAGGSMDLSPVDCSLEESGNPACVGNQNCSFMTPWVYISSECGYSNQFRIMFQCVPIRHIVPMCTVPSLTGASYGYISSPGYPRRYSGSQNCSVTVVGPSTGFIRIHMIDLYLASYRAVKSDQWRCIDKVFVSDGFAQTKYMCTADKRDLIFTSSSNQATIFFSSTGHDTVPAKGFWLYYEVIESSGTMSSPSSSAVLIRPVSRPMTGKVGDEVTTVNTGNGSRNAAGSDEQSTNNVMVEITDNRTTVSPLLGLHSAIRGNTTSSTTSTTTMTPTVPVVPVVSVVTVVPVVPAVPAVNPKSSTYFDGPRKNSTKSASSERDISKPADDITSKRIVPASSLSAGNVVDTVVTIRDARVKLDIPEDDKIVNGDGVNNSTTSPTFLVDAGGLLTDDKVVNSSEGKSIESQPIVEIQAPSRWNHRDTLTDQNLTSSESSTSSSIVFAVVVSPMNASSQRQLATASHEPRSAAATRSSSPETATSAVQRQNPDYVSSDFGVPEIGAVTGGSACLVLLLFVAPLAAYLHFRKRRFLRTKRFLAHNNSYKNVIMAFGGDDDVTIASSTPEMRYGARDSSSGSISPSSSSVLSTGDEASVGAVRHGHSCTAPGNGGRRAADSANSGTVWMTNGSTSGCGPGAVTAGQQPTGGAAAAAGRWLTMMPPIDERLEDVYAAFKRQCDGTKKRDGGEETGVGGDSKMSSGRVKVKSRRSKSVDHLIMRRCAASAGAASALPESLGAPTASGDGAHIARQTGWGSSANTGQQQPHQHQQQHMCVSSESLSSSESAGAVNSAHRPMDAKRANPTSYERLQNANCHGNSPHSSDWHSVSPNQLPGKLGRAVSTNSGGGGARIGYFTPGRVPPPAPSMQLSLPRGRQQMCGVLVDTPYEANLLDNEEEDIAL